MGQGLQAVVTIVSKPEGLHFLERTEKKGEECGSPGSGGVEGCQRGLSSGQGLLLHPLSFLGLLLPFSKLLLGTFWKHSGTQCIRAPADSGRL